MTTNLRDRLAEELDHAMTPSGNMAPGIIAKGHSALRARRLIASTVAAAAVVAGATWTGSALNAGDQERTVVADRPTSPASGSSATASVDAQGEWDAILASLFGSSLPEGFQGVTQSGGGDTGQALQFWTTGPEGDVQLNAMVYVDAKLPTPTCATTPAQQCRTVAVGGGSATVLRNVYTSRPSLPQASQVFVSQGEIQTILNVVEVKPGQSQFSMADLASLAHSDLLTQAVAFATANTDALKDYGVTTP